MSCSSFARRLQIYVRRGGEGKSQGFRLGSFKKIHISTWSNSTEKSNFPGNTSDTKPLLTAEKGKLPSLSANLLSYILWYHSYFFIIKWRSWTTILIQVTYNIEPFLTFNCVTFILIFIFFYYLYIYILLCLWTMTINIYNYFICKQTYKLKLQTITKFKISIKIGNKDNVLIKNENTDFSRIVCDFLANNFMWIVHHLGLAWEVYLALTTAVYFSRT